MFGLGPWEIGTIVFVALLVLGPTLLPRLGRRAADLLVSVRGVAAELNDAAEAPKLEAEEGAKKPS